MSQLSNLNLKIIWDFFVNFTISMTFNTWDFIDETIEIFFLKLNIYIYFLVDMNNLKYF